MSLLESSPPWLCSRCLCCIGPNSSGRVLFQHSLFWFKYRHISIVSPLSHEEPLLLQVVKMIKRRFFQCGSRVGCLLVLSMLLLLPIHFSCILLSKNHQQVLFGELVECYCHWSTLLALVVYALCLFHPPRLILSPLYVALYSLFKFPVLLKGLVCLL